MAHSQKPWIIETDTEEVTFPVYILDAHMDPVVSFGDVEREIGQMFDDARLISTAPDLLEACKAAIAYIESDDLTDHTNAQQTAMIAQLRAAIAKAEGPQ